MNVWAALAGGFVGTLVLTTILRGASELRWTRIDLPFLLGTMVTTDRKRAKAIGYVMHFVFGLSFALGYLVILTAIGRSGWLAGAVLGVLHAAFAGTALVNVLLPVVHPRMGDASTGANRVALLETPGFLMLNYGPATPVVMLVAHIAYGAIVGGFIAM
ncbi:MAG TPA: hypothetical protein VE032_03640 [Actinomycetota bacterium]|nr:hypothetical protein [Actinomycetota bacterium]